jgi:hypothetical protein
MTTAYDAESGSWLLILCNHLAPADLE